MRSQDVCLVTDIDIHKVNEFVRSIKEFAQTDMISSEANTKKKLVEPLLELLGWDMRSSEVRLEYPVRIGTLSIKSAISDA